MNNRYFNNEKIGQYIFIIAYLVFSIFGIVYTSVFGSNFTSFVTEKAYFTKVLFFGCLYFNIFIHRVYNLKKFIVHFLITLLLSIVAYYSHNNSILFLWLMLLAMYGLSLHKVSKYVLAVTSAMLLIITAFTAIGYGPDILFERSGSFYFHRHSFGFIEPNIFSAYLLQICMALVCIRWKDFCAKDNIFIFAIWCIVTFFANSRTTSLLLIILLLLVNFSKFWCKTYALNFNYFVSKLMLILCPLSSFVIAKLYGMSFPFALWLDELSSYRFRNICYSLTTHPITLFGGEFYIFHEMNIMGNLYGALLLKDGLIILLLFLTGYALVIRKACKSKCIPLLIMITLTLLQAMSERYALIPYINFSFLSFSVLLNNEAFLKE